MIRPAFSDWIKWESRSSLDLIGNAGNYIIRYSNTDICETVFSFTKDIVYIGKAQSQPLKKRLAQFNDTISGKRCNHGGADRMRHVYSNYKHLGKQLYVSVVPAPYRPKDSMSPEILLCMGEVAKLEYVFFAEFYRLTGNLPIFNRRESPKYSKR